MPRSRSPAPRRALPQRLRYVSDEAPGIRRVRRGRHFAYLRPGGAVVRDARELARIRALAIPPAYEDVWICPWPNGHIQATARDARGRKQYRYHADWRRFRDRRKFEDLYEFGLALPALRRRLDALLRAPTLSREKVLAAAASFLDRTLIRVGNEEYARHNSSFGLTTLRSRHAAVSRRRVTLRFRGKSGQDQRLVLPDARLARLLRRCQELPGQLLFQYVDEDGKRRPVRSNDVNAFLRESTGLDEVSARNFRTWGATALMLRYWGESVEALPELGASTRLNACLTRVAKKLGNTLAVCRKSYVDPRVLQALLEQPWPWPAPRRVRGLAAHERLLLALLRPPRARRTR